MSVAGVDLRGRTAIVTGASSGLGVVFAEALAQAGGERGAGGAAAGTAWTALAERIEGVRGQPRCR